MLKGIEFLLKKSRGLLLKRSMFTEDSWYKTRNDGCFKCWLGVCCKFIKRMYHSGSSANELALKAKDDVLSWYKGRGFSVFNASAFSVILRRYSLPEVPGRRIHDVIAYAMSICVAVGNKVMDTRLPQPVGCGDKYDVDGLGYRLLRHYTPRNDGASNGEGVLRPWCQKILGTGPSMTGARGANSFGRSMIEMLGVLAIIGVLSVGGIAGYSKAMEKYKVNKILEEYSFMLAGIVEHYDDLSRNSYRKNDGYFGEGLVDWIEGLNLVPSTWHKINDIAMSDSTGNVVQWYKTNGWLAVDFYLGGWSENADPNNKNWLDGKASNSFSPKLCVEILGSLIQPLHQILRTANTFNSNGSNKSKTFYGDNFCGLSETECLNAAKLTDFHQACQVCETTGACAITMWFQL